MEGYEVLSCVKGGISSRIFNSTYFDAKLIDFCLSMKLIQNWMCKETAWNNKSAL